MTGGLNSHWICVMPTMNLGPADKDYAVVGMVPGDAAGMTYIYGRALEQKGELKAGKDIQGALDAFREFTVTYQGAADDPRPLFRRRASA